VQALVALAEGGYLRQEIGDLLGETGEGTGRGPVRKGKIDPEISQDLGQVGLAAPVKPADPGRFLLGAAEIVDIPLENAAHAVQVFALADERFQLIPERVQVFGIVAGNPLVDEPPGQGIFEENFSCLHGKTSLLTWMYRIYRIKNITNPFG
jgi:hypothetical protein